ncbi:hypothetical protein [Pedobacter endophyticus]|uniref:Uncharacterized protein n=1 Tax=Pedobacter endophyticus TaxID=2789740 RepID=A0A7S9L0W3_9SPHI|nr:hypothetical protein [Pedobacter endophyticus]QPH40435.1 hypothetical protein IZT61_03900 [Pedobacter endophyticus]
MKSSLLVFATVILSIIGKTASAQTDNATLNIRLYPIQTITVNPTQKTVNLDYKTTADYADGVSLAQADHLTVYSTGAFIVKVKSAAATLTGAKSNIDANDVSISPLAGTSNQLANATYTARNLSNTDQTIISSNTGSVNKNFNITYKAAGSQKYVDKYFKTENPTVYTTTVTYTIEAN